MESTEWPKPKRDTTDFLFLYPFFYRGRTILVDSPQHSREMNLRRANQVAAKAIEKTTRLAPIYKDREFPVIDLEDPCGLLPLLPVQMSFQPALGVSIHATIGLRPILERKLPASAGWLGHLQITTYNEDDVHVHKVSLNQPGENRGIELGMSPGQGPYEDRNTDSYPANAQAMNFISMVDDYLDKLDQNRLVVVGR